MDSREGECFLRSGLLLKRPGKNAIRRVGPRRSSASAIIGAGPGTDRETGTNQPEDIMLSDEQRDAYKAFFDTATDPAVLGGKTTFLVQLAAAMAMGCQP